MQTSFFFLLLLLLWSRLLCNWKQVLPTFPPFYLHCTIFIVLTGQGLTTICSGAIQVDLFWKVDFMVRYGLIAGSRRIQVARYRLDTIPYRKEVDCTQYTFCSLQSIRWTCGPLLYDGLALHFIHSLSFCSSSPSIANLLSEEIFFGWFLDVHPICYTMPQALQSLGSYHWP